MLDEKDMEILRALKKNSKNSVNKLAKLTGIPPATVHHRIKKLEKDKVIQRYTIDTNDKKLGYSLHAYIFITVQPWGKGDLDQRNLADKLANHELVQNAAVLAGDVDLILKIHTKSMDELNNFILDYLRNIEGIGKTKTLMVMHSAGTT